VFPSPSELCCLAFTTTFFDFRPTHRRLNILFPYFLGRTLPADAHTLAVYPAPYLNLVFPFGFGFCTFFYPLYPSYTCCICQGFHSTYSLHPFLAGSPSCPHRPPPVPGAPGQVLYPLLDICGLGVLLFSVDFSLSLLDVKCPCFLFVFPLSLILHVRILFLMSSQFPHGTMFHVLCPPYLVF